MTSIGLKMDNKGVILAFDRPLSEVGMRPEDARQILLAFKAQVPVVLAAFPVGRADLGHFREDLMKARVFYEHEHRSVTIRCQHGDRVRFDTTEGFLRFIMRLERAVQDAELSAAGTLLQYDGDRIVGSVDLNTGDTRRN